MERFLKDPLLILWIWKSISSYGGMLGGTIGWLIYVRRNRLDMRLYADIRWLVCSSRSRSVASAARLVSDHVGAAVDPSHWYAALAMDYPRDLGGLDKHYPQFTATHITAWNLGLLEFLYLVPVNLFILWYAFRPANPNGIDGKKAERSSSIATTPAWSRRSSVCSMRPYASYSTSCASTEASTPATSG